MSKSERRPALTDYRASKPLLRHIRVMGQFYRVMDDDPETRPFVAKLHCELMGILEKELAPHALTLALALTQLEDAYPQIVADTETEDDGDEDE